MSALSQDTSSKLEYFFLLPALRCFARRYALHPEDKVMAKCLQHIVHSINFVVGPPIKEAYQHTFVTYWKPDTADSPDRFQNWLNRLDDELRKISVTTPSVYGGTRFITMTSDSLNDNLPVGLGPIGTTDVKATKSGPAPATDSSANSIKSTPATDSSAKPIKSTPVTDSSAKPTKSTDAAAAPVFTTSAESAARAAKNIANGNKAASITDPLPTPATLNQRGRKAHPKPGLSAVAVAAVERRHVNPRQKAALNRLMMSAHQARFSANRNSV